MAPSFNGLFCAIAALVVNTNVEASNAEMSFFIFSPVDPLLLAVPVIIAAIMPQAPGSGKPHGAIGRIRPALCRRAE
jgi:hypothetical protein